MPQSELPDIDSLWDYNDPATTEERFSVLLPKARSSGDQAYLAELLTQIARTQGLQRRFDNAHATLDEVVGMLPGATPRARVRYLLDRGRVFNSSGNPEEARGQFLGAWHLAVEYGEEGFAVDAAHMLGIVEPGDTGLDWNLAALALSERSDDTRAQNWKGSLLNNIGWTYHDMGRYEDALEVFGQGLEWQLAAGREREARIAAWTVARALRSLGRLQEALTMQRRNLEAISAIGESDGFIEEEIGECLLALGQVEEARAHFAAAYTALSHDSWLAANDEARLERLKALGES
jgi:tetratricopeptide (TPR) repeat protein